MIRLHASMLNTKKVKLSKQTSTLVFRGRAIARPFLLRTSLGGVRTLLIDLLDWGNLDPSK
jgi:hypothetical protein